MAPGPAVLPYVKAFASRIVLVHATLIDGTGAPTQRERSDVIGGGKIVSVSPGDAPVPRGATVLDLSGRMVMPGRVGMHLHMYNIARPNLDAAGHSEPPLVVPQMTFSSPGLYLDNGVTTLRTTGSVDPYADLNLRRRIETSGRGNVSFA